MNNWHDCIVSFIDMIGISEKLRKNSSESVMIMRRMHEDIYKACQNLPAHEEICFWNDSILLMGYVNTQSYSYHALMEEVIKIKRVVDDINPSYAICVKG
jgi:hypothetical protein